MEQEKGSMKSTCWCWIFLFIPLNRIIRCGFVQASFLLRIEALDIGLNVITRRPFADILFYSQRVHEHVLSILKGTCRPSGARQRLTQLPASGRTTQPFLWKDIPLPDDVFLYPPPFGFRGLQSKVEDLLKQVNIPFLFHGSYLM